MLKFYLMVLLFFTCTLSLASKSSDICTLSPQALQEMNDNIAYVNWLKSNDEAGCSADPVHPKTNLLKLYMIIPNAYNNWTLYDYRSYTCDGNYLGGGYSLYIQEACLTPGVTNIPPPPPTIQTTNNTIPKSRCGSIIQTSNQVIGETISLTGVPFYLTHFSSRVTGRLGEYKIMIPLSGSAISENTTGFNVVISDEQNNISHLIH